MKILFTIPNFETAGSGYALYQLASGLKEMGWEVHIMARHGRGGLVRLIKEGGLHFHVFSFESPSRPITRLFKECRKVARKFKSIGPDIIYSYHYAADYTEPLAAKMAGIPWIHVKKNMSWYGPSQNAWYLRSLLSRKINVQNSEMESEFLHRFSKKLVHIPIGVDTKKFYPISEIKKHAVFTFIHVSSLLPVKGVEHLINAYLDLCKEVPDGHQLLIVGPDESDYVLSLKKKSEECSNIAFLGVRKDINELLNRSHCFIQPSLNKGRREGAPIALQEAMAAGLVCIGSRVAGINDQLKGFEELQYDSEDEEQLKQRMKWALGLSIEQQAEIGGNMRQRVLDQYSLQQEVQKTNQLLRQLSNRP
jgi:glycosyltransferase involved in cell wall biosynthesis